MSEEETMKMAESMLRIYNTWRMVRSLSTGGMIGGFFGALSGNRFMLYYTCFFAVLLAVSSYMMKQAWRRLLTVIV